MSVAEDIIKGLESAIAMEKEGYMYDRKYRIGEVEEFNGHNPIYENAKGCVCYPAYLRIGERGWLLYEAQLEDEWMAYPHRLHTSIVKNVAYSSDRIVITTENTRLTLKVIK